MFNSISRIMNVDDVRYVETIPDTMYRSHRDQIIIVRSKGKASKGAIKGSRFYAFVVTPEGVHRKMRGDKGTIRYFDLPYKAASEAAKYHRHLWDQWLKTQDLSDIMGLTLIKRSLERDIERLRKTLASTPASTNTAAPAKVREDSGTMLCASPGFAGLPSYLQRSAALAVGRVLN